MSLHLLRDQDFIHPDLIHMAEHAIYSHRNRIRPIKIRNKEILNKFSPLDWVRRLDELFDTKFHPPESFQSLELTKLVKVNENFGTMRKMIEILNHDYSKNCKNGLPIQ